MNIDNIHFIYGIHLNHASDATVRLPALKTTMSECMC